MPQDRDQELDPKLLRFGMSKAEVDELRNEAKRKRRKLGKKWKPKEH
jgi:hypothetical protein